MTLPILFGLQSAEGGKGIRRALQEVRDTGDARALDRCRQLILRCGAAEHAARVVRRAWSAADMALARVSAEPLRAAGTSYLAALRARAAYALPERP
jgi:geranylgeranyl pyrophosphate synthase